MVQYRIPVKKNTVLPKGMLEEFRLQSGDELVGTIQKGKIILTPNRREDNENKKSLSAEEKRALARAQKKIERIKHDMIHSRGLTQKEAHAAIKAGLIDKDQAYFWLEEWQKDLRESEKDFREGRVSPGFGSYEEVIKYLHQHKG